MNRILSGILVAISAVNSSYHREAQCNFSDSKKIEIAKQDDHNLAISFSTKGQVWMNSGTRQEGTENLK